MATIHKGKNHLVDKAKVFFILAIVFFIPTLVYFYAFFVHRYHFPGIYHLAGIIPAMIGSKFYHKSKSYWAGYSGESRSLDIFERLPDSYHVFTSIPLYAEGKQGEIDALVIGPNGLFVVEVKGMNGAIEGDINEKKWIQHKIGRKGGTYFKRFNNPVKQAGFEVWLLSTVLKREGISNWVEGSVYFSNPECTVNVFSPKVPVFQSGNDLYDILSVIKLDGQLMWIESLSG